MEFKFVQGKRLVFVTNNSTKSRKQYGKKFESLGLCVSEVENHFCLCIFCATLLIGIKIWTFLNFFFQEEIFASSFAAAAYLKSIDFPKDKKVCIV